ncbi:MAG: hypothetical protein LBR56_05720, partial [Sporomusaceae bacterium]|nr:hypothetical protein [Sporomusaceae bacterium]
MKTTDFLANAAILRLDLAALQAKTSPVPFPGLALEIGVSVQGSAVVTMDSILARIDGVIAGCSQMITLYTKVKAIIESAGKTISGSKAGGADKIQLNQNKKREYEAEILGLEPQIKAYDQKERERNDEQASLDTLRREIEERQKSGNNWIPFYGIAYAVETSKMADRYNSRLRDWWVRNDWLNANRERWHEQKARVFFLKSEIEKLKQENDRLQREGGVICELLTTVSSLIAEFHEFLLGLKQVKNDLINTFLKDVS